MLWSHLAETKIQRSSDFPKVTQVLITEVDQGSRFRAFSTCLQHHFVSRGNRPSANVPRVWGSKREHCEELAGLRKEG